MGGRGWCTSLVAECILALVGHASKFGKPLLTGGGASGTVTGTWWLEQPWQWVHLMCLARTGGAHDRAYKAGARSGRVHHHLLELALEPANVHIWGPLSGIDN